MLEVTRKCNFKCTHCLRGNAQNKTMRADIIYNFFQHVDSIGTLTIGGGEPSLAVPTLHVILDAIMRWNVNVENIFMVTNGKRVSVPLLNIFSQLLDVCSDNGLSAFTISNDIYHTEQRGFIRHPYDYVDKLYEYDITIPEDKIYEHTTEKTNNWLARGRAKNWGQRHDEYLDNLRLNDLENPTAIYGEMYVCHNGDVVGDANMAYNDMKKFIRGNILEWDTLINNLKTSTVENYHWCKNNCSSWKDCYEWESCQIAKSQIEQKGL